MTLYFQLSGASSAAEAPSSKSNLPVDRGVGQRLSNFTLKDALSDHRIALYGFRGKNAVVLAFLGIDCPIGNLYVPRLIELKRAYADRGVVFLGINSNEHETIDEIRKHAKEYGIEFPVLKDTKNLVADIGFVERTCEVLVLDGTARIRYRGAIDDQYGQGSRKGAPAHNYLRNALDAVLAQQPVAVPATRVAGCLLNRVKVDPSAARSSSPRIRQAVPEVAASHEEQDLKEIAKIGKVSYTKDVQPILQHRCQSCHRPGQVGPFSLLTYEDADRHSEMIREVVDERRMPPWHADGRYGHFSNDRRLTVKERATLLAWIDQGQPKGEAKDAPSARSFPEGWSIGKPDVIFQIPEAYLVPPQGVVEYVHFRVPTNFKEDRWIQAAEAVPSDRSVVHHIIVYLDDHSTKGAFRDRHLCGYAPGDMPSIFPPGTAKQIPAGSDLIFEMHYTPNGKLHSDRSQLGLIFAKEPVKREAYTVGIANNNFQIPPQTDNVAVPASLILNQEVRLLSFMPHMHLRGKRFQYTITKPGEAPQIALSIPAYDFGWQTYYTLSEPMTLPKGTKIDCLAHYDNSEGNPNNPDPSKLVRWGNQTFNEMMIGYIDIDAPAGTKISQIGDFDHGGKSPTRNPRRLQQRRNRQDGQTERPAEKKPATPPSASR